MEHSYPSEDTTPKIHISSRWSVIAISLITMVILFWFVRDIILLTLTGLLFAIALTVPIRMLKAVGVSRGTAFGIIFASFFGFTSLLLYITAPTIFQQANEFLNEVLPTTISDTLQNFQQEMSVQNPNTVAEDDPSEVVENVQRTIEPIQNFLAPLTTSVSAFLVGIVYVVFLGIFLALDPDRYQVALLCVTPKKYQNIVTDLLCEGYFAIREWWKATFLGILFVGILAWIGLRALNVPQAELLALFAGITSAIPNFGPLLGILPAGINAYSAEVNIVWVAALIFGLNFLYAQIVMPLLMDEALHISPAMVIISQILFGFIFGFLGLLLAMPIVTILKLIFTRLYIHDYLQNDDRTAIWEAMRKRLAS